MLPVNILTEKSKFHYQQSFSWTAKEEATHILFSKKPIFLHIENKNSSEHFF